FYLKQQDYESFVKRAYCQVPKDLRKQLNALISEEGMEDEQNIDTITSFIQYYLTENTNYTLNPGVVPKNKDLVSYFLFESQKGYCVYYASAATMLFRCMGIPARYVEGYVLNTDNAEYVRNTETGKLYTLTDNDAHAWVEIYRSGYGWVPIEVTKGRVVIEENDFEEEMPDDEEEDLLDNTTEPTKTMEPQTSQDTQKEKNGNIENQEKVSTFDWEKARVVLVPIGEIFFVLLFLYIRKCLLWWYRAKQQERANENEKTKLYYKKIMRILQLMKKSSKKEELRDLIKEKDFCTEPIMEQRFHTIVQIMNHYAYSKDGVEEQEVQFIKESYEILRQEFYLQKNWLQKLYYQYILVL
ncbi:MAG: transglutaminase domain-containing protein, partial [Lachnospiraceae bacterium]|nr:transglutaminase domain-containing protein [Lachnospiraceae bacterium]